MTVIVLRYVIVTNSREDIVHIHGVLQVICSSVILLKIMSSILLNESLEINVRCDPPQIVNVRGIFSNLLHHPQVLTAVRWCPDVGYVSVIL